MLRFVRWLVVAIVVCGSLPAWAGEFFFKDGDVIVMIGDSITEQHLYSNFVEMWTITRFPNWKLTFRNVGIGGDRSVGGNARFARDVLLHKPTAMTVGFGMNDGGYRAFGEETFKPYTDGLQGMADQAKAAKIRVAWVTPQPLDTADQGPTALTGYNQTLEQFSAGVKAIVLPYIHDMAGAYAAADLVVSRSGATTVAELAVLGKRAILVPYPYAADNHQEYNARSLAERGGAEVIVQKDLAATGLAAAILKFARSSSEAPSPMPSSAAEEIVRACKEYV